MFTLTDGRDYLYQWDINRSVRVSDPSVTEVHFCNRTGDCSLVTKVYANPTDSELYADIPNILLQSPFDIRVFAYCDGYTKVEETFKVKARTKPDDYVYTETEILQYSNIVARMDSLEDSLSENLEETVNNYLDEHPVQVDLTGYAKETYVDNAIQEYDQTITQYVDDAIDNIDIPDVDLSNYYTKAEVDDKTKKDSFYLDLTGCTDTYTDAPADVVNFATEYFAQKCEVNVYGRYSGQWGYLPLDVTYLGAGHIDLRTTVRMQRLVNGTAMPVYHFQLTKQNDVWRYKVTSTDVTIATKEYVDGLFAGIATAEERSY